MRSILLSLCFISSNIFSAIAQPIEKKENAQAQLEHWYTRVKIAGIATLSVVAILTYLRVNKSLDSIDSLAQSIQPGIKDAATALGDIKTTTHHLRNTIKNLRPAFLRIPEIAKHLRNALKKTHLTMKQVHAASAQINQVAGKANMLLTPKVLSHPQIQQVIQATTTSIAAGVSNASAPTPAWTPGNLVGALAANLNVITAAVHGWRSAPVPVSQVATTIKKWRWFGWFRK